MKKLSKQHKYIILGAGPAGLQLAYFFQKENIDYILLEKGNHVGTTFLKHPVHGQLISVNKVHTGYPKEDPVNLRWDWHSLITDQNSFRFTDRTTDYFPNKQYFVDYLIDFSKHFKLNVQCNTQVSSIKKEGDHFLLNDSDGNTYTCQQLIVATGVGESYLPNIMGIEHAIHYNDMSLNKELFNNKRVLIIGKGNSGFETAEYLKDSASVIHIASPNPLKYAWRTHYVGHVRAVNNNFLDTYQLKTQNAVINANITSIKPEGDQYRVAFHYTLANDELEDIIYDHVIACTGFKFDTSIFDKSTLPNTGIMNRFPEMTNTYESTNIANCYYAGTIMQYRDFKKKQSGFVHGFRYNVEFLARYLLEKNEHKPFPAKHIGLTENSINDEIIKHVNQTSALWQQTGYLCDLITLDFENGAAKYYESMPKDYVTESFLGKDDYALIITLEFGQERIDEYPDVFAIPRVHKDDYKNAHLSTGIHPIVRLYKGSQLLDTHHLIEDFDSIWCEEVHTKPLKQFLCGMIKSLATSKDKETA